ncbi:MAG TPA: LysM peptidoglycan-binding domain-containing M23 family metallopeptidase [bacterium]|nr:LysM peptidoglycan-binding domain-containing M23 family metallopeptidase [bacterium]
MRETAGFRGAGLLAALLMLLILTSEAPAAQPVGSSYTYITIREGQTLWSLARAYGISVELIAELNGLRSPEAIRVGQRLKIPVQTTQTPRPAPRVTSMAARHQFVWPARGMLTSRYGWRRRRHHSGIDIGADRGAPIVAAGNGVVVYAGWYHAYGRTVIIEHGNGWTTLYGHASSIGVRPGQSVSAGQLIARVGCTGRCTGPHLHFEIRVNGRAMDPLSVSLLDPLQAPAKDSTTAERAAAGRAAPVSVETVVHRSMTADGPGGHIIQNVEDTLRDGKVVRRVEVTTKVEGGHIVRLRKTYGLVNGELQLRSETREVVDTTPERQRQP